MSKKDSLTKILAVVGTVLAWFPILAPILLTLIVLVLEGAFHFDFLMPAELFPVALVGGGLLLWAALRARTHRGLIGWSLVAAVVLLVGSQGLAVLTGLASGETDPGGWQLALVLAVYALFLLALIAVGVGGALLWRDLFRSPRLATGSR